MKRLPSKSVQQLLTEEGIDIRKATLIVLCGDHYTFPEGELVKLHMDDSTLNPYFVALKDIGFPGPEKLHYVNIERLGIYDPDNHEHVTLRAKLRLKGAL